MDDEEDDVPTCPLCLEELDATDRAVEACQCGYQVCLWCLHHIREQLNSRCPACRTPYQEQNFKYAEVNHEEAAKEAKERATAKKERERREKIREIEEERARAAAVSQQKAKNNLKHARVLQKNLVYVIGLSLTLAREDIIRRADMFGKFGRLTRILVNRAHPFNTDAPGGPSISAYVQYVRDSDASAAVKAMNNAVLDGREIRCAIATTKYCDTFVRNAASSDPNSAYFCGNHNCMYYHSLSQEPILSREEVLARQLGPPPPAHLFLPADTRRLHPGMRMPHPTPPPSGRPIPSRPVINAAPKMSPGPSAIHPPTAPFPNSSAPIINPPIHSVPTSFPSPLPSPRHPPPYMAQKPMSTASPHRTPPSSPPASHAPQVDRSPRRTNVSAHRVPSSNRLVPPQTSAAPQSRFLLNSGWDGSIGGQGISRGYPRPRPGPAVSFNEPSRSRTSGNFIPPDSAPPGFEEPSSPSASSSGLSRPPGFEAPKLSRPPVDSKSDHGAPQRENGRPLPPSTIAPPPGFEPGPVLKKDVASESVSDVATAWSQEASSDQVFLAKPRRAASGAIGQVGPGTVVQDDTKSRSELAQVLAKIGGDLGVSSEIHDVHTSSPFPAAAIKPRQSFEAIGMPEYVQRPSAKRGPLDSLFGIHLGNNALADSSSLQPTTSGAMTSGDNTVSFSTSQPCGTSFSNPLVSGPFLTPRPEVSSSSRRSNSRFGFAREESPDKPSLPVPQAAVSLPFSNSVSMGTPLETQGSRQNDAFRLKGKPGTEPVSSLVRTSNDVSLVPAAKPLQVTGREGRSRFDFADQGSLPPKASAILRPVNLQVVSSSPVGAHSDQEQHPRPSAKPLVDDAFIVSFAQLSREEKLASLFNSAQWSADQLPPMPAVSAQLDSATPAVSSSAPLIDPKSSRAANHKSFLSASTPNHHHSTQSEASERVAIPVDATTLKFTPPGFREATPGNTPEKSVDESTSTSAGVATTVASGGVASTTTNTRVRSDANNGNEPTSSNAESAEEQKKRSRAQRRRDKKARHVHETTECGAAPAQEPVSKSTQPLPPPVHARPAPITQSAPRHAGQTVIAIQSPGPDSPKASTSSAQTQSVTGEVAAPAKQQPSMAPTPDRLQNSREPMQEANIPISSLPQEDAGLVREDSGLVVVQSKANTKKDKFMSVSELEKEIEAAYAREAHLKDKLLELQRRIRSYDNVKT